MRLKKIQVIEPSSSDDFIRTGNVAETPLLKKLRISFFISN